jgi:hypothetical protein
MAAVPGGEEDDFLDWLSAGVSGNGTSEEGAVTTATTETSDSVDSFFSSLLGVDDDNAGPEKEMGMGLDLDLDVEVEAVEPTQTSVRAAAGPSSTSRHEATEADTVLAITKLTSSSLANVTQLKQLLQYLGRVPIEMRGRVWSILVAGSCTEDFEAKHFRSSKGDIGAAYERTMTEDIATVLTKCEGLTATDTKRCEKDLRDLLVLYCLRHDTEYHSILCHILAPLVVSHMPTPRAIAYSCFYSLCKDFVPLINLTPTNFASALNLISTNTRLLVCYHFPQLALHLDRLLPGWERFTMSVASKQAAAEAKTSEAAVGLDELEKMMGLGLNTLEEEEATRRQAQRRMTAGGIGGSTTKASPSSFDVNSSGGDSGCIPVHWVCGIFASSLPIEEAALLWDWAVTVGLQYAGVYLLVALLGIYADALIQQSGSEIRVWLEAVSAGRKDWYKLLQADVARKAPGDWGAFTRGWISSTRALRAQTPLSFQKSLADTETTTKELSKAAAAATVAASVAAASTAAGLHTSSTAATQPVSQLPSPSATEPSIFNRMRHMSSVVGAQLTNTIMPNQTKARPEAGLEILNTVQPSSTPTQSITLPAVCMETDPAEVVPSICFPSHGFRNTVQSSTVQEFWAGLEGPLVTAQDLESLDGEVGPVYFGVDCRTEPERALGRFPKAYLMDPLSMEDSESISALLHTLRPLAGSVHVCIIGSGEGYFRTSANMKHRVDKPALTSLRGQVLLDDGELVAMEAAIADERARLDAAAMFFIKRSFAHVSIFSGGFVGAAQHLHETSTMSHSSPRMNTVLVDLDEVGIREFIGLAAPGQPAITMPSSDKIMEKMQEGNRRMSSMFSSLGATLSEAASKARTTMGGVGEDPSSTSSTFGTTASPNATGSVPAPSSTLSSSSSSSLPFSFKESAVISSGPLGSFTIGDDSDEDEEVGDGGGCGGDDDAEQKERHDALRREQALAGHKLSGLTAGDSFSAFDLNVVGARFFLVEIVTEDPPSTEPSDSLPKAPEYRHVLITEDRFLILNANGAVCMRDVATVSSNVHLTALKKITFRKSQPDRISLVFMDDLTTNFKLTDRGDFVQILQTNMMRFK